MSGNDPKPSSEVGTLQCPLFGEVRKPGSPTPRQTLYEQSSLTGAERIWGQTGRSTFAHSHAPSEHSPQRWPARWSGESEQRIGHPMVWAVLLDNRMASREEHYRPISIALGRIGPPSPHRVGHRRERRTLPSLAFESLAHDATFYLFLGRSQICHRRAAWPLSKPL